MHLPNKESLGYSCFSKVVAEVRDMCVLDLAQYTTRLPERYRRCLKAEPEGVYIYGSLEPILVFNQGLVYYTYSQWQTQPQVPNIQNFGEFINAKEPVVDQNGRLITQRPYQFRNHFKAHCQYNYSAIYLAFITAWETLKTLHRNTHPTTNVRITSLNIDNYVHSELLNEFDEADQPGLGALIEHIMAFIGRDICNVYHLRLKNTTLYLEKGNDFRVIEYYRYIFDQIEEQERIAQGY